MLEARQFVQDVYSEIEHYRRGHSTYSVRPGLEHAWLNLRYLSLCMSPNNYIQFLSGISILIGMILCARKGYLSSVSLLVVPIAYLIYFSSTRHDRAQPIGLSPVHGDLLRDGDLRVD